MTSKINAIILKNGVLGILLFLTSLTTGCKKEIETLETINSKDSMQILSAGDGQFDALGYGYDVTGEYASLSATRFKVIDIAKLYANEPDRVNSIIGTTEYTEYTYGDNAEQFSYNLTGKYSLSALPIVNKVANVFSGTMDVSFHQSGLISNKYSYANASKLIKQKQLVVNVTTESIRKNYLSDTFKSDVQSLSPEVLVTKYGTHVLSNIILGAKLDIYYRTETTSSNKGSGVRAGFSTNVLAGLFKLDATGSYADSTVKSNSNQTLYYKTVGGDGSRGLLGDIKLDNSPLTITIGAWQSTCTLANATMIQIDPNGFVLLSDLIEDPAKSTAVKSYINQYLINHSIKGLGDVPIYSYYNAGGTDHYLSKLNQTTMGDGGFKNEGIQFYALSSQMSGTVPVYSYYNSGGKDHYFSTQNQPTLGGGGYVRESIAFYAYPSNPDNNRTGVYSYFNSSVSDHYFTTKNAPSQGGGGFLNEGIQFYLP